MIKRRRVRLLAGIAMAVAVSAVAFGALTQEPPAKPVELKILQKLVGEWKTETTVTVRDGQPREEMTSGTASRKWALGSRFVEESGQGSDGNQSKSMFTYDADRKAYRFWHFSSSGIMLEMQGNWDEASQTLSLRTDLGNGLSQHATIRFVDDSTHTWTSKVSDRAGKVYFDGGGKLTRKK